MNELELKIATKLIEFIKENENTTGRIGISYGELADRVGYPLKSENLVKQFGKSLGNVSMFFYEKEKENDDLFVISAMVVSQDTVGTENPEPSSGFYTDLLPKLNKTIKAQEIIKHVQEYRNWKKLEMYLNKIV